MTQLEKLLAQLANRDVEMETWREVHSKSAEVGRGIRDVQQHLITSLVELYDEGGTKASVTKTTYGLTSELFKSDLTQAIQYLSQHHWYGEPYDTDDDYEGYAYDD